MMKDIFKLVRVGPRCLRRIVNVFKLLKVIWKRNRDRFPEDDDLKVATLLLMLLASDESTREVTYTIFEYMESGAVRYHRVVIDERGRWIPTNNLAGLFRTEMRKRDKTFVVSTTAAGDGDNTVLEGTLMAYIDRYLAKYEWSTVDDWNETASKFLLARCFSFFRLVTAEMETNHQRQQTRKYVDDAETETNRQRQQTRRYADDAEMETNQQKQQTTMMADFTGISGRG